MTMQEWRMEGLQLQYCDIHQTLQRQLPCRLCKKQDGDGFNGKLARIRETLPLDEQEMAWRRLADKTNLRIIRKYTVRSYKVEGE